MKTEKEYYMQPESEVFELRSERNFCQSPMSVKNSAQSEGVSWGGTYDE